MFGWSVESKYNFIVYYLPLLMIFFFVKKKKKIVILKFLINKSRTHMLWAKKKKGYTYPTRTKWSKDPIQLNPSHKPIFAWPTQVLPNIPGPVFFAHTSSTSASSSLPANTTNQKLHNWFSDYTQNPPFWKWPCLHQVPEELTTSPAFILALTKPHSQHHEQPQYSSSTTNSITLNCIPFLLWSSGFSVVSKRKKISKRLTRLLLGCSLDWESMIWTSRVRVLRRAGLAKWVLIGIGRRGRIFPRDINLLEPPRWPLLFATWIRYYNVILFFFFGLWI